MCELILPVSQKRLSNQDLFLTQWRKGVERGALKRVGYPRSQKVTHINGIK